MRGIYHLGKVFRKTQAVRWLVRRCSGQDRVALLTEALLQARIMPDLSGAGSN